MQKNNLLSNETELKQHRLILSKQCDIAEITTTEGERRQRKAMQLLPYHVGRLFFTECTVLILLFQVVNSMHRRLIFRTKSVAKLAELSVRQHEFGWLRDKFHPVRRNGT